MFKFSLKLLIVAGICFLLFRDTKPSQENNIYLGTEGSYQPSEVRVAEAEALERFKEQRAKRNAQDQAAENYMEELAALNAEMNSEI